MAHSKSKGSELVFYFALRFPATFETVWFALCWLDSLDTKEKLQNSEQKLFL